MFLMVSLLEPSAHQGLAKWPLGSIALAAPGGELTLKTVEKGSQSGVRERLQIAIRSQVEWTELWTRHNANKAKPPPPPKVNFGQEMVVAVFLGEKPTGGYAIEITRAAKTDRGIEVGYREQTPAPGAMTIQALTQPFHIVRIPKSDGDEVTFRRLP
jgi:hypothetical protein